MRESLHISGTPTNPGRTSTNTGKSTTNPGRTPTIPGPTSTNPGQSSTNLMGTPTNPGKTTIKNNSNSFIPRSRTTFKNDDGTSIPRGGTTFKNDDGTSIPHGGTAFKNDDGTSIPRGGTTFKNDDETIKTSVQNNNAPIYIPDQAPAVRNTVQPDIPQLNEYIIDNCHYTNPRPLGEPSGEGSIFLVENGGKKFVLKLYIPGHNPNTEVLNAVKNNQGGFLVNLIKHGVWVSPVGIEHYYELMDYLPHGTLADVKIENDEQFNAIALNMMQCIHQCHEAGFLHRDIKPENFLLLPDTDPNGKRFVVSDFGIAAPFKKDESEKDESEKDESEKDESEITVLQALTSHYASAEACNSSNARTVTIGRPSDYYSMGATLLAMCIGVKKFPSAIPQSMIDRCRNNRNSIYDIAKDYLKKFNNHTKSLLRALLVDSANKRATRDDCLRWVDGETLQIVDETTNDKSGKGFRAVFNDEAGMIADSPEDLADMIITFEDQRFSKKYVYDNTFLKSILSINGKTTLCDKIDEIINTLYPATEDRDGGVYAACLALNPNLNYIDPVTNEEYCNLKDLADVIMASKKFYSEDLKRKSARLWAYFKMRGDESLKSLPDWIQPIVEKSGYHGVYMLCKALNPELPYIDENGNTFNELPKIADFLWENRENAAKSLANSDNALWTYLSYLGENGKTVAEEFPNKINNVGVNAVYELCLRLNPKMPFYGKNGNKCNTAEEIADELWNNESDYKKELSDPTHPLWSYIKNWNKDTWNETADLFPKKFENKSYIYIYCLIYRLDPSKPYLIKYLDDSEWHSQYSVDELLDNIYKHGIHPDGVRMICEDDLITWLILRSDDNEAQRGLLLNDLVGDLGKDAPAYGWYLLYTIFPELSLTMQRDPNASDYVADPAAIGTLINLNANSESISKAGGARENFADLLENFKGSRLYQFMNARKMDRYADGICVIVNINQNINNHKSAPYDIKLATWKTIDYLNGNPIYKTSSGKIIKNIDDVKQLSDYERKAEVRGGLPQFCALSFHERRGSTFSVNELKKYYNFIDEFFPTAYNMSETHSERSYVIDAINKRNKAWKSLRNTRIWVLILCLIPLIASVAWMLYISFTEGTVTIANAFNSVGKVVAVILAIVGVIGGLAGGIIGAIIGGLAGYWIPILLFGWLAGIGAYIIAAIIGGIAIFLTISLISRSSDKHITNQSDYDTLYDQAMIYVVCKGLGTDKRVFGDNYANPVNQFKNSTEQAAGQKSSVRYTAIGMVILTVVSLGLGILLARSVAMVPSSEIMDLESIEEFATPVTASEIVGEYTGTLNDKDATLTIKQSSGANYPLTATIKSGKTKYTASGDVYAYDSGTTLEMFVHAKNGIAQGDRPLTASVEKVGNIITISGTLTPTTGAAPKPFIFSIEK